MDKVTPMPDRKTIEAEAAAWIAQLDGAEPSQQDLVALREWMNRSPQHRAEIERLSALWDDLNVLTRLAVPLPGRRGSEQPRNSRVLRFAAVTAALACVIGVAAVAGLRLWPVSDAGLLAVLKGRAGTTAPVSDAVTYATAIGQQRTIHLADGSRITLNTGSEVSVDLGARSRRIRLVRGEALFEVAHDPGRPFLVYAGTGLVRAVGTAFSVYLRGENSVSVTVTEGEVELAAMPKAPVDGAPAAVELPPAPLVKIKAGQNAIFGQRVESIQSLAQVELERQLSWRNGLLRFDGEPLSHVVEEVSRYTTQKIVILDPALADLRIGGYFKVGETEAMFEALETSFGVHVERISDNLVHLSAAP